MKVKFLDWSNSGCWINEDSPNGEYIHIVSINMLLDGDEVEFQFAINYDDFNDGKVEILKLGKIKGEHKDYWKNLYDEYDDEKDGYNKAGRSLLYNEVEWEECDERITIPFLFELREECNRISEEKGGGSSYRMDFFTGNHNSDYLKRRLFNVGKSSKKVSNKDMGLMLVKFTDFKGIGLDDVYDEDEGVVIKTQNHLDWIFEVNGKSYYWEIIREEYYDLSGDGKGDGYLVRDMNDNRKVLCDSRWKEWMRSGDGEIRSIDEKFNDYISVSQFMMKVYEYCYENLKYTEYDEVDVFSYDGMEECGGKKELIGKEIELY